MLMLVVSTSPAAMITVINDQSAGKSVLIQNSIPSGDLGGAGYYLYSTMPEATATQGFTRPDINALPAYVSFSHSNIGNRYLNLADSDLTVAGTLYTTGFLINNTVTITLGAGVPSQLRVGLLLGNSTDNDQGNITLSSPTSSFSTTVLQYNDPATPANEWVVFDMSGGSPGDQIQFAVSRGLGGVTFRAVPEPNAPCMIVLGLAGLLGFSRRQQPRGY